MLSLGVFFSTELLALTMERHNHGAEDVNYSKNVKATLDLKLLLCQNEVLSLFLFLSGKRGSVEQHTGGRRKGLSPIICSDQSLRELDDTGGSIPTADLSSSLEV